MPNGALRIALVCGFLILPFGAFSQKASAVLQVGGPVDLSTVQWRTRCGNDPAWAAANFDDSKWPVVNPKGPLPSSATPLSNNICWYRTHVEVHPGIRNLGIGVDGAGSNFSIFVNGWRIGAKGEMPPHATRYSTNNIQVYQVSQSLASYGSLTIAMSVWRYADYGPHRGLPFDADLALLPELNVRFQNLVLRDASLNLLNGTGIGLLVALLAIGLFCAQPTRKQYLWLGVFGVSFAVAAAIMVLEYGRAVPMFWPAVSYSALLNLSELAYIEFFLGFLGRRPNRWVRVYESSFAIPPALVAANLLGMMDLTSSAALFSLWPVPGEIILLFFLFVEYRRRNREAAIMIFPTLLWVSNDSLMFVLDLLSSLHVNTRLFDSPIVLHLGFLPLFQSVGVTLFWLSMGVIILRRTARDTREQARLASEVDAARSIQQLLIPASATAGSEFQTESVYLPASEVGGDFYQLLRGDDGSLLLVVGDVSGKGLRAAMTVSAIVGALRGCSLRMPAEVLAHLNRILAGQIGGFVTCCAAHISTAGVLTLANAGHIPPYRNGEELAVESELPLGIASDVTYREVQYQLDPNDRLTFVSDGVMEATNQKRELFGFDHTREISVRPAREIAEAARAFGQQDDITVLTMQYTPVAAYVG